MLKGMAKTDCQIVWVAIEKDRIPLNLREDKGLLYQLACEVVIREAVKRTLAKRIRIIVDRYCPKKRDRDMFESHILTVISKDHAGNFLPKVLISQYDSAVSSELQAHDFVVGAIFQSLERDVDTYIKVIESRIISGQRRW